MKVVKLAPSHPAFLDVRQREKKETQIYEMSLATSRYPKICVTPELDRKMQLVAGYHKLLSFHFSPRQLSKAPTTVDIRKPKRASDPGKVLQVPKKLDYLKRCEWCRNVFCRCETTVSDPVLDDLKARFEVVQQTIDKKSECATPIPRSRSQRSRCRTVPPISSHRSIKPQNGS